MMMERRLFKPVAAWTVADVQAFVDARVAEGQRLDYREGLSLARDSDRSELAKDASGNGERPRRLVDPARPA